MIVSGNPAADKAKGREAGFGMTINIVNEHRCNKGEKN